MEEWELSYEDNPYKDKPEIGSYERQVFFRGAKAAQKKLVEWLEERNLEKGHPNCALFALEDWQSLCKSLGVK